MCPGVADGFIADLVSLVAYEGMQLLAVYLIVLGWASLLFPRSWFVALLRIAFPFLPESLEQFREDDYD